MGSLSQSRDIAREAASPVDCISTSYRYLRTLGAIAKADARACVLILTRWSTVTVTVTFDAGDERREQSEGSRQT